MINADSMQVYRRMDIGTAKPSHSVLAHIPHHLIDVVDPCEQFNAGHFVHQADTCVTDICGRKKIPVLSGGTAFYLKNFIFGLPHAPPGSKRIRDKLTIMAQGKGGHLYLLDELKSVDPPTAARLNENDIYRIVRALEVYRLTGRALSSFEVPAIPRRQYSFLIILPPWRQYSFLIIGLRRDRNDLYDRINRRVEEMFAKGLVKEVKDLISSGYGPDDPGMRAIGYREFFRMQRGCRTLADTSELIKRNSRRFAKRQIAFFKALQDVRWYHPDEYSNIQNSIEEFSATDAT